MPLLPPLFGSATSQRTQAAPEGASPLLLALCSLKDSERRKVGVMRASGPPISGSGARPLPVGTQAWAVPSSHVHERPCDSVGRDLGRNQIHQLLPSTPAGQVPFSHAPADVTHKDASFAFNYFWPNFDPISLKIEHETKTLVSLFNQNSEVSSWGLNDFMFSELLQ